ncbi:hypothetical protein G210_4910, partial [Candida maltosa Xu316]
MTLLNNTIPNLHYSRQSNNNTNTNTNYSDDDNTNKNNNPDLITSTPTKTPWYHRKLTSSSDDEDDDDAFNNRTPSPSKANIHQIDFSSTPLYSGSNSTISFSSPMNRLNELHLESEQQAQEDEDDEDDDDDDYDEFSLGNKTITTHSESDSEDNENDLKNFTPKYINTRKRVHSESPDVMMSTPNNHNKHNSTDNTMTGTSISGHKMSICNTTTNNSSVSSSIFKFSYSNTSDSTPCPRQPKRKKLKFKHDGSNKNILDLSYAKKTTISDPSDIPIYNDDDNEPSEEVDDGSNLSSSSKIESTPISQSTPASSRASTPPLAAKQQQQQQQSHTEYGEAINGYRFVKPQQYKYETPINNNRYSKLRESYNSKNYQIMGELPVTSAGMMMEEGENVHVGDRRINDPYLMTPMEQKTVRLRELYFKEVRLPLLPPFFNQQDNLTHEKVLTLINHDNLVKFYENVISADENMLDLLKRERIKWHPDKWVKP